MRTILDACGDGLTTTARAGKLMAGLLLLNFIVALPAAWALGSSLHDSLKTSRAGEGLRQGFDMGWYGEYQAAATGLEKTFRPTVMGAGAFLDNHEAWASGELWRGFAGLVAVGVLFALTWTFLLGGILDRFIHPERPFSPARYFASCGRYAFRFYRLAALSIPFYYLVYKFFDWAYGKVDSLTRDITSESTLLIYSLGAVALTVFLLHLVQISFSYAKIAIVREERSSVVKAAWRGFRFVVAHPWPVLGLALGLGAVSLALLGVYSWLAPGPAQAGWVTVTLAFLAGQIYLGAKVFMKIWLLASQLSLYRQFTPAGNGERLSPEASGQEPLTAP